MKVYEFLGIDFNTVEGIVKILDMNDTGFCPYGKEANKCSKSVEECNKCRAKYLFDDIPTKTVKRWETYVKEDGTIDIDEMYVDWEYADCQHEGECTPHCDKCLMKWPFEDVEIPV